MPPKRNIARTSKTELLHGKLHVYSYTQIHSFKVVKKTASVFLYTNNTALNLVKKKEAVKTIFYSYFNNYAGYWTMLTTSTERSRTISSNTQNNHLNFNGYKTA